MSIAKVDSNYECQPLREFVEKAYLNYSMYVILDRALPHIGDGLKPVQRRIVYAMSELGLASAAKFKKSARTVGDVLGKYHPHGDAACYEAMVLMAQPFSYRYPLIAGQGNWGSMDDPKSFAAMRYTEAKLSPYAELLLQELGQGTVEWGQNFDGTLEEPTLLPARVPNILLNGASGIAVGMSTDIPPHNLREVVAACICLLDKPTATLEELCEHIKGPDFPTKAEIITPAAEIFAMYQSGTGSVRMRAVYSTVDDEILITAIPYQVSGSKIQEQIAAQMQAKKLPMVVDLRDESDHENPTRIVIILRSNRVDVEALMAHLFATTDLEQTYRVNLNIIGLDAKPQVKNLLNLLGEWLRFRAHTVRQRLQYNLTKILARLHTLDGLLIVFLNLDEVIYIIRNSDHPKTELMARFSLTIEQADAILETKLRHLAKLEEMKIRAEQDKLSAESNTISKILGSESKLTALLRKELLADMEKYGDDRCSPLMMRSEAKVMRIEEVLPNEAVTVVLSQQGWVRAAKGHELDPTTLSYKSGDKFKMIACGRSNQLVVFIDSTGRSYTLPTHKLPSARGQGEPLTSKLTPPTGASFEAVLLGSPERNYILSSDAGYGFIATLNDMYTKNRAGKALISLPSGARVLLPQLVTDVDNQLLVAVTSAGRLLVLPVTALPVLPRGKGNKIINIAAAKVAKREEHMLDLLIINKDQALMIYSGKHKFKLSSKDLANYYGERGHKGGKLPRGFMIVDRLESI